MKRTLTNSSGCAVILRATRKLWTPCGVACNWPDRLSPYKSMRSETRCDLHARTRLQASASIQPQSRAAPCVWQLRAHGLCGNTGEDAGLGHSSSLMRPLWYGCGHHGMVSRIHVCLQSHGDHAMQAVVGQESRGLVAVPPGQHKAPCACFHFSTRGALGQ